MSINKKLMDEINYEIEFLIKSGFYNQDDLVELIDDEFIEENLSIDFIFNLIQENYSSLSNFNNNHGGNDFLRLKNTFNQLTKEHNIISIHNAGYDVEEGIQDSFELYNHLKNNNFQVNGFCFYSLEDVETAILENILPIAFGDFEYNEKKSLEIGKILYDVLLENDFELKWNQTVDERIEIINFNWFKEFDNEEYSMDGALNSFISYHKEK